MFLFGSDGEEIGLWIWRMGGVISSGLSLKIDSVDFTFTLEKNKIVMEGFIHNLSNCE